MPKRISDKYNVSKYCLLLQGRGVGMSLKVGGCVCVWGGLHLKHILDFQDAFFGICFLLYISAVKNIT